jgi:hypothetical protein
MKTLLFFCTTILVTGCSNRAVYENMQLYEQNQCSKVPPSEYRECREAAKSKPYHEYEREYKSAK